MIVPMKRLTVVALAKDADATVDALGALGVVHLTTTPVAPDTELEATQARLAEAERALNALPKVRRKARREQAAAPAATRDGDAGEELVRAVLAAQDAVKEARDRESTIRAELDRIAPLGDFDPASVRALEASGVHLRVFAAAPKQPIPEAEGITVFELARTRERVVIAAIATVPEANWPEAFTRELEPFALPTLSVAALREDLACARAEADGAAARLEVLAARRKVLADHQAALEEQATFLRARAGADELVAMATTYAPDRIVRLAGWLPGSSVEAVRAQAAVSGWGLLIEDPGPDDEPPTHLENPAWARPIEVVMKVIGVSPGYWEVDISPAFLLFLTVFFAMLVGDAGYGLLFLGATLAARRAFPEAPADLFKLLALTSFATIAWGIATGTFFGIASIQDHALVPWLTRQENVMLLCFALAATHLTLAHLWNVVRYLPSLRALAQIGWIGITWVMFFAARSMVLVQPFPDIMFYVLGASLLLVVAFLVPPSRLKTDWVTYVMLPLTLVGNFVDVVSYVRLFAVGAATFAVAAAFNEMAAGMPGSLGPAVGGVAAALILFLGHGLNILLACMGVLVHGVRLNTLEFASHMELRWAGRRYEPFSARAPRTK